MPDGFQKIRHTGLYRLNLSDGTAGMQTERVPENKPPRVISCRFGCPYWGL